jgi:copper(I)-binding protein
MSFMFKAALAAAFCLANVSAFAHASLTQKEAQPGVYFIATMNITHGCEGQSTLKVRIGIPDGVTDVKPQPKAGWRVETAGAPAVREVTWTGSLADAHFDQFVLQVKLPDTPGAVLYFPTVQECEKGEHRWVELPKAGEKVKSPAPALRLTGALTGIEAASPWARATAGKVGGIFLTLRNGGAADRLLGGSTPAAAKVELHNTVKDGDVMRMRQVDAISLPANGYVELAPGGLHVMLVDLKAPLRAGDMVPVTLRFEKAGEVTIQVPVLAAGARGPSAQHEHKH